MVDKLPQVLADPGEEELPGYTPDANPADCAADGLVPAYEKVVDFTYNSGNREEIQTNIDIGIAGDCLSQCTDLGGGCLAVTLQNERGGRQRCFSLDTSAGVDQRDPDSATGVTYFEKICSSMSHFKGKNKNQVIKKHFKVELVEKAGLSLEFPSTSLLEQRMKKFAMCRVLERVGNFVSQQKAICAGKRIIKFE